MLQPIRVRPKHGRYELILGERRYRAATRVGLREIPAIVTDVTDDQAFAEALIENIHREDLNALDRAQALVRLRVALGRHSWEEVGRAVGISRQHIHRLLNVTRLPDGMREDVRVGRLTEKHVRALFWLRREPAEQRQLWERIHAYRLSGDAALQEARALRQLVARREVPEATGIDATGERSVESAIALLVTTLEAAGPGYRKRLRPQLLHLHRLMSAAFDEAGATASEVRLPPT